ncbi:MAG TPA: hypothetical protein VHE35_09750, partial [Kofleriaceae bacterium]|nr:hypothetical protein [Kofleriaceae bacterium]
MHRSRWPLAATSTAIALALASTAHADGRPRLKVVDHGAQVEVVVSDVRLVDAPTMKVNGSRLDLPLAGHPLEVNDEYDHGLVMRIDVRGETAAKTLSVKLRRDPGVAVALAKGAVARQEDDGVHLWVPISPSAPAVPTAAVAAAAAVPPPAPAPVPVPATVVAAPAGVPTGTAVTLDGVTAPPAAAASTAATPPAPAAAVTAP